jgi:hypothetical protein
MEESWSGKLERLPVRGMDVARRQLYITAPRRDADECVRALRYWFTQTTRDFLNWACSFLSSRATLPSEAPSGWGKSDAGLSP